MANQITKEEQLIQKFTILKKSVFEERQKNSELQSEINSLKEELTIQKEITNKLQIELAMYKQNPSNGKSKKSFFNNFNFLSINQPNEEKEVKEEEKMNKELQMRESIIQKLTLENSSLKEKILSIQQEKDYLSSKLKEQMNEYDKLKQMNEKKISEIHQEYEHHDKTLNEEKKRIESMSIWIKKLEQERIEHQNEIDLLMFDMGNKANGVETLFKEQAELLEEIEELKKEIAALKNDNERLLETLETIMPVTKKTVFQGLRIISTNPRKTNQIEITYGEIDKCIVIKEKNVDSKVYGLKYIPEMKKIDSNIIRFRVKVEDNENEKEEEYLIEFAEKYIQYILKYYRDGTFKKKIVESLLMSYTIGDICV